MKQHKGKPQSAPSSANYAQERKQSHEQQPRGQRSDQSNIPPPNDDRGGRQSQGDAPRTGRNDKNEKR